jgi:hypothetical protein
VTGDTNDPDALQPIGEQMGEGWSHLYALILTAQPTDTGNTPRGVGAYISFQDEHGPGIRGLLPDMACLRPSRTGSGGVQSDRRRGPPQRHRGLHGAGLQIAQET